MATTVTTEGPFFDRFDEALEEIVAAVAKEVGDIGRETVLAGLNATLRNPSPTGGYRDKITVYAHTFQSRVHDQMSVYGPWLEGTGSRNATTRFKGYANFRQATQQLDRMAADIAERVIAEHISKLGG